MKKNIRYLICFIFLLGILAGLTGCKHTSQKDASGFLMYYVDKGGEKISSESYTPKEKSGEKLIKELLDQMKKAGKQEENVSAIPPEVQINGFSMTDGIVTVDFAGNYLEIDKEKEVLCRAAIVLTLTQTEEVEYVAFTIDESPYRQADGNFVGAMKASDFVSDLSGDNDTHATDDFVLYFANEQGSMLKEYDLFDVKYGGKSKEEFIIEQLIRGPKKKEYVETLSNDLKLISVVTTNNICYVDFDDNFLTEQSKVSNQLVIYSIVNSLSELNEIHKVQISVNGNSEVKYHDDIPLAEPFIRNLDLVENIGEETNYDTEIIMESDLK